MPCLGKMEYDWNNADDRALLTLLPSPGACNVFPGERRKSEQEISLTYRRRKERPIRTKSARPGRQTHPRHGRTGPESPFAGEILARLYTAGAPLAEQELLKSMEISKSRRQEILGALDELCREKIISCKQKAYALRKSAELFAGPISVNPKGYGFVSPEEAPAGLKISQDVFIPPGMLGGAAHGDKVLVRLTGRDKDRFEAAEPGAGQETAKTSKQAATGCRRLRQAERRSVHQVREPGRSPQDVAPCDRLRFEGRVVAVLSRVTNRLVGVYMAGAHTGLVIPEDSRFPYNLVIRREDSRGAKNGEAVLAEVSSFAAGQRNLPGIILEVLGDPGDIAVQTEMVIRKFDLPHVFSREVIAQAEALDPETKMSSSRTDLRSVPHVTIDGETARDFDDAVAVESTKDGWRLYVSIADVSHYVRPGSPVDAEAWQRGTSVYFPTRVIPMLPERLSNNLCSLVPDEDRYTFTAVLDFDQQGRRLGKRFIKSIIRSRHRLTYTIVKQIIVDLDEEMRKQYAGMVADLESMGRLALALEEQRRQRGSIGFEIPEPEVVLGEGNAVLDIRRSERNQAHKLIEEFMLAANEAVAEAMEQNGIDSLYRIHEAPDPLKVAQFTEFAQSMGLAVAEGGGSPKWFGKVLAMAADTPQEYIISNLLLRTMQQARYSPHNLGHFGLAATHYTHFTSPIRRYPDLMVHRALAAGLQKDGKNKPGKGAVSTEEAGTFLSRRERVAVEADREMTERLQAHFMAERIGETFEAVISGVTAFGLFVELTSVFVSGAVPISEIRDDYYELEEGRHRLIGRKSGKVIQLGDLALVQLVSVETASRRINFRILETEVRSQDSGVMSQKPEDGRANGEKTRSKRGKQNESI